MQILNQVNDSGSAAILEEQIVVIFDLLKTKKNLGKIWDTLSKIRSRKPKRLKTLSYNFVLFRFLGSILNDEHLVSGRKREAHTTYFLRTPKVPKIVYSFRGERRPALDFLVAGSLQLRSIWKKAKRILKQVSWWLNLFTFSPISKIPTCGCPLIPKSHNFDY